MFYRGPFYHDSNYRPLASVAVLLPVLLAQAVWWAAILDGAQLAALLVSVQVVLTFWLDRAHVPSWSRLLLFIGSGLALDALTVQLGLISFRDGDSSPLPFAIPLWLLLLWLSFALTVPRLQQWLPQRQQQCALFAIAAPLAYYAGAAFAAAEIHHPIAYAAVMVSGWLALALLWQPRRTVRHVRLSIGDQQQA